MPLGLVRRTGVNPFRLTRNHQVLAYGYELDGERLVVRIYDPNWPDDDSVALVVDGVVDPASATLTQSTGEAIAAFFVAPWSARPVGAWR